MGIHEPLRVSAADFTRQFGQLRQALGDGAVHVTHHGRETHVLVSAARYRELNRSGARSTLPSFTALAEWVDHAVLVVDEAGVVRFANGPAHAMLDQPADSLSGMDLYRAVPALVGSVIEMHLRRAQWTGERASADLPSVGRTDRWWRLAFHPAAGATTVLIRDITGAVTRDRLADETAALAAAVAAHGGIARLRLNPRGHIETADAGFCVLVGLDADRLRGVALTDLIPTARKPAVRECLDRVLGDGGTGAFDAELLSNTGAAIPVASVVSILRGTYGTEGAAVLITRA